MFRAKRSTSEMVSSRRCLMECGSRRLAFFGVAFAGVAAAPSLAIGAVSLRDRRGGEEMPVMVLRDDRAGRTCWVYAR